MIGGSHAEQDGINREDLGGLWDAVYERLAPDERSALGEVHIGSVARSRDEWPFAFTNADQDSVNLTLELKPSILELNLTGWKEAQSEALKRWLQTVPGENTVNALDGYEVVAFAREAHKKTPSSKPYWQVEYVRELGRVQAPRFNAGWISRLMIKLRGDKTEVKPAFHVRRTWELAPGSLDDGLVGELVLEVQRLLPILREIWARP